MAFYIVIIKFSITELVKILKSLVPRNTYLDSLSRPYNSGKSMTQVQGQWEVVEVKNIHKYTLDCSKIIKVTVE